MSNYLVRGMRKWDLVALAVNSLVGAGIFGLPSRAYALAGVYSMLAYIVCAIPIFLIVLCFAEVSSRFENTGGPYLYARSTFGLLAGFEIGWLSWIVRLTAFAALCNLFVDYLSYFIPGSGEGLGRSIVITAVVAVLTTANLAGVRLASFVGNIFVIGKLIPLVLLVVVGSFFIHPQNFIATTLPNRADFSSAVLLLAFALTGFEMVSIPAGEAKSPVRHIPFALLTGTSVAVVLYVAIQAVCIGTLPSLANSQRPLADVGERLMGTPGSAIISLGALISVTGTMNAILLTAPRLLFAMAEQGQLPRVMMTTHRRYKTPFAAILITALGMLVLTLSGTFASAATLSTIIRLVTYAVTCAALPILRRRDSQGSVRFVAPAGIFVAITAVVLVAWLLLSSSWPDARMGLIAAAGGLLLYVAMPRRRQAQL